MSGARQFRAAVVIGYMLSITWLRRNLLSLVWLFATPFSLLFIITVTTGGRSFALGVIGSLLLVLSTVGTGLAGDATWYRLETKLQDFFVASPVNQLGYLLGIAFAGLFFASPALVVLLPLLVYIGLPLISLPLVLLSLTGVWLFSSAIGYLVSTFTSNLRNGWQSGLLLSVLVGIRDSSTQHSASNIRDSDNQCRPSHTRRHGQHPDPTLLVSCCRLVSDRSLAHNRLSGNLASS